MVFNILFMDIIISVLYWKLSFVEPMKRISTQKNDNRNILSVDLTHNSVIDGWLNDECKRTSLSRQDIIRLTLIEKIDQQNIVKWRCKERHEWKTWWKCKEEHEHPVIRSENKWRQVIWEGMTSETGGRITKTDSFCWSLAYSLFIVC